ncbi:MAG: RIP metalloprotease [Dehalococcoidia bacterium]|nr:RIP metalloprotease [Dehalococcoidia bacterium]
MTFWRRKSGAVNTYRGRLMDSAVISLAVFFPVLIVLVVVHELGHYVTAKMSGVVVQEFGIGYPPRLFAVRWRNTDYSINLLPLGGFVKLLGEEDPEEPGSLASKSMKTRLIILSSGSLMNALLPVVLFTVIYMIPRDMPVGPVEILQVLPDSPAQGAGLQTGDRILKINDRKIQNITDVSLSIQVNLGSTINVMLQRGEQQIQSRVLARWSPPPNQGATGIMISMPEGETKIVSQSYPIWKALPLGVRNTTDMLTLFKNGILGLFSSRGSSNFEVTGPIGIARMTGEVAQQGFSTLLQWMSLLSINLAILNMLPIPMLDGGRAFFVVLEGIRGGKRIPPEKEALAHLAGFILLMIMIVIVSYGDILKIIKGDSLFP